MSENKISNLYSKLLKQYGQPEGQWKLWCKRPAFGEARRRRPKSIRQREEVIIGAILTQRANWKNVMLAIDNLKRAKIYTLSAIHQLGLRNKNKFADLIRPSGFYKQKCDYLLEMAEFFKKSGGIKKVQKIELKELREKLLDLYGVGPETADSILLYGLDKPIFVIDEYTRRLVKKEKFARNLSYDHLQKLFESNLPRDFALYQDFHALIVINGKISS
ncbi:MAG TPA: endonuclease [Patescibacteria group bacterium]|nr:endonuclease [Patescibacteria group bacterium]